MPTIAPGPEHWTLRLKNHKTTILLFVTESQSFASIKSELLAALKATRVGAINGKSVPDDAEDIIFGVPVDKNRIEKGWVDLVIEEPEDEERTITLPKGVRKSVLNGSPLGAGLKDGGMLAFRFRSKSKGDDNDSLEEGDDDDGGWDVVMPRYEEEEEEEEEVDEEGGGPGREGEQEEEDDDDDEEDEDII